MVYNATALNGDSLIDTDPGKPSTLNTLRDKWNKEFSSGKWDFLRRNSEQKRLQLVAQMIERQLNETDGGCVVDLGSGEGHLCNWLDGKRVRQYVAVDISDVALNNIVEANIPVTRICESLAKYSLDENLQAAPLVIVANEVLYYEPDSVDQLKRIAEGQKHGCVVLVSVVGPHPDKPNWTASSIRLWKEIDQLGWHKLEAQVVKDEESGVVWDIVAFEIAPKEKC